MSNGAGPCAVCVPCANLTVFSVFLIGYVCALMTTYVRIYICVYLYFYHLSFICLSINSMREENILISFVDL